MACKFESEFKHRDERILNSARRCDEPDSRNAGFTCEVAERQIRFTVAFGETITIAASACESQSVLTRPASRYKSEMGMVERPQRRREQGIHQKLDAGASQKEAHQKTRRLKNEGVGEHVRIRFLADLAPMKATSVDEIADHLSAPLEARR